MSGEPHGAALTRADGTWFPDQADHPEAILELDEVDTVVVRRRRLRVSVRRGNPMRPPLLLCNGLGASLELLTPFVDAAAELEGAPEIIRFDVPGLGGSAKPVLPYHLTTLAPLVEDLLAQLGHDRFDVLGISWGGTLAQQLAARRRGRVRRMVLVATGTGGVMVPARPGVLSKMISPRRYRDPSYARSIAGEIYGGSMRRDPALATDLLHVTGAGLGRGYYYQLFSGSWWTSLPLLPWIRQPTLIVAGNDDPLVPTVNAHIMHRLLPHSTLHIYDGGHLALVTEPTALAPVVESFLAAP